MCGRYYIAAEDSSEELRQIIEEVQKNLNHGVPLKTHGEVFPSDVVPVRLRASQEARVIAAKWGFAFPGSSRLIINAKSETMSEKPMFRNATPCLIPATNYFEWETVQPTEAASDPIQLSFGGIESPKPVKLSKPRKEKRAIRPDNKASVFYMAGLLRRESPVPVFTIITREAAPELAYIHDRMPFILTDDQIPAWLEEGVLPEVSPIKYHAEAVR
ncbi:putative SOS response-associated peptidase YoqW [Clostridia bacterium]|nr:putative SOS response-associated peptidase YoqW [Clostridia bacterium]